MEHKFPVKNSWKFGYTLRGHPLFWTFWEKLFCSPLCIARHVNQNFWLYESPHNEGRDLVFYFLLTACCGIREWICCVKRYLKKKSTISFPGSREGTQEKG